MNADEQLATLRARPDIAEICQRYEQLQAEILAGLSRTSIPDARWSDAIAILSEVTDRYRLGAPR